MHLRTDIARVWQETLQLKLLTKKEVTRFWKSENSASLGNTHEKYTPSVLHADSVHFFRKLYFKTGLRKKCIVDDQETEHHTEVPQSYDPIWLLKWRKSSIWKNS